MIAILALLGGLWMLIRRVLSSGFDTSIFWETLARARWEWLLAGALLTLLSYYVRALRWYEMLRPLRANPSIWNLCKATAIGYTATIIFGRPGEFVRPYLIASKESVSFSSQLAAWALERVYDLLIVLASFGFAVTLVSRRGELAGTAFEGLWEVSGLTIGALCALCLVVLLSLHIFSESLESRILSALAFLEGHHQERVAKLVRTMVDGLKSTHQLKTILLLVGYSILEWLLLTLVFAAVFVAFPETAHFHGSKVLMIVGLTTFGGIIQLPAVGGGMQVATTLALTELFRIPLETASGITLVLWATNFLVIVPFGFLFALREGLTWRRLKQIEKESIQ